MPLPFAGPIGLWHNTSVDIVHHTSCGPISRFPGEKLDAQRAPGASNTEGTIIEASHPAAPLAEAAARWRRGMLAADKRVLGPPVERAATAVVCANISRAKPGDDVSLHAKLGERSG
jgi:hypothetical protein